MRRSRMGMIGGGSGAFIGPLHRIAAELDREIELVAGVFSSDADRSRHAGETYRIDPARAYGDLAGMLIAEKSRADGIVFVAIVSPSHNHLPSARAALAWPCLYPWPARPAGLVEDAFDELARRWQSILDVFDANGVDVAYEIHPGEGLHDGVTFEMFLDRVSNHPRANILYDPSHFVLQQLDYLAFIDIYHERIKCFHANDAEFRPSGRSGVYGGYQSWVDRPGHFHSLGDGQVDFPAIFSKMAQRAFPGWAVLEWECALKHPGQGAVEGAPFIADHIIRVTERAFDDFAAGGSDRALNRRLMGIG